MGGEVLFLPSKSVDISRLINMQNSHLNWVQNSVFEGEISEVNLKKLKDELRLIMVTDEDSVIIYTWRTERYTDREIIGVEKGNLDTII